MGSIMQSHMSLMGKKEGMLHVFDKDGNLVACSVISIEPNVVTQIKTVEKDGYTSLQMGSGKESAPLKTLQKRYTKAKLGHLK